MFVKTDLSIGTYMYYILLLLFFLYKAIFLIGFPLVMRLFLLQLDLVYGSFAK